jgi:hypothetical protein
VAIISLNINNISNLIIKIMISINQSNINQLSDDAIIDIELEIDSMELEQSEIEGAGISKSTKLRVQVDSDMQGATFNYRDCSTREYSNYLSSKEWRGIL